MKKGRPSMKISKEEFPKHLSAYTEDEKFYRDVYLHEKEHPETFKEYLDTLDPEYISRHRLYVPGISASNTLLTRNIIPHFSTRFLCSYRQCSCGIMKMISNLF